MSFIEATRLGIWQVTQSKLAKINFRYACRMIWKPLTDRHSVIRNDRSPHWRPSDEAGNVAYFADGMSPPLAGHRFRDVICPETGLLLRAYP